MVVCYICIHCIIFEEMEWWEIILLVFIGVLTIYNAIITFTHTSSISLDYEGFTVTTRSRLTSKLMMDSYKWKEIDELRFNMSYASNRLRLTIYYKRGPAKTIDFSVLNEGKYRKLARYYRGREGIIKPSYFERKRKGLYEKDW